MTHAGWSHPHPVPSPASQAGGEFTLRQRAGFYRAQNLQMQADHAELQRQAAVRVQQDLDEAATALEEAEERVAAARGETEVAREEITRVHALLDDERAAAQALREDVRALRSTEAAMEDELRAVQRQQSGGDKRP